jgi:HAD superfamily 5'-nucleotidase-like hydrolase
MTTTPDWIGFDLDHTLARYKLAPLHALTLSACTDWLRHHAHIPSLAFTEPPLTELAVRGAVIDRRRGNVLLMDDSKRIYAAWHGARTLSAAEIDAQYHHHSAAAQGTHQEEEESLDSFQFQTTRRFWPTHSYFETFLPALFVRLVDWLDAANARGDAAWAQWPACSVRTYEDVTDMVHLSLVYIYTNFRVGAFFEAFRNSPGTYLHKRPFVRKWIERVRATSPTTRIFLATNSMAEFTDLLCRFVIGDDWTELFDLVVFKARKPLFFSHGCAHTALDQLVCYSVRYTAPLTPVIATEPALAMQSRDTTNADPYAHLFEGGCAAQAEALFRRVSGKDDVVVWYAGDHLVGDCRSAARCCRAWRACAVVEELAPLERRNAVPIASLCDIDDQQYIAFDVADPTRQRSHVEVYDDVTHAAHARFFFAPDGALTYQASILRDHCSLVVSDIHQLCSELNGDPLWLFRRAPFHSNVQFVKQAQPRSTNK